MENGMNLKCAEEANSMPVYISGFSMVRSSLEEIRRLACIVSLELNRLKSLDPAIDANLVDEIIMKSRDEKRSDKAQSNIEYQFDYLKREVESVISDLNNSIRKIREVV